ncbi:unnamed protein product, partial [Callosobruchus maculatus]
SAEQSNTQKKAHDVDQVKKILRVLDSDIDTDTIKPIIRLGSTTTGRPRPIRITFKDSIFCGTHDMPLRGKQADEGVLLDLLKLRIDSGDNKLKSHFEKCRRNAIYTSPRIQNELINLCGEVIQENVISEVRKTMAYSILADETADVSGKEQLSIGVRFYDESKSKIREEFVGFVELKAQNASAIAEAIDNFLISSNLSKEDCVGFGFDGCSTMAGKEELVKSLETLSVEGNYATRKSAYQLHSAVTKPVFIVSLQTIAKYSAVIEPVVNALQAKSIDMISVGKHIKNIKDILRNDREFPDRISNEILQKARAVAMDLNIEISVPRLAHKQTHRSNPLSDNDNEYWRRSLIIPYIDSLISSLNIRFSQENTPAFALSRLHPLYMTKTSIADLHKNAESFQEFYNLDITGELNLWHNLWVTKALSDDQLKDIERPRPRVHATVHRSVAVAVAPTLTWPAPPPLDRRLRRDGKHTAAAVSRTRTLELDAHSQTPSASAFSQTLRRSLFPVSLASTLSDNKPFALLSYSGTGKYYMKSKGAVTTTEGSKHHISFTEKCLYSVVVLTIEALLLLASLTFRLLLTIFLKIKHGRQFGGFVTGGDAVWFTETHSLPVNHMVVILDSKIQSAEEFNKYVIHTLIQKSWHHNHPQANLKLKSTYKKVAGYVYYLKHKLKLSEYHTTLTVDEKFAEKPVLIDILSQCSMRPLPKNNSALWELVTFDKPLETDSIKQGMFTYVVIFRFHHALADGISIANSLARNLTNETSAIEGHTSKLIGTMSQRKINLENSGILSTINNVLKFIYVIAVSASVNLEERRRFKYETNCLHGPELSGQKYLVCASEQSEEQLVQNVKKMKKGIPGSTFSAILLTAVSRAIGKHFGTHCQHTPSSIVVVLPVPIAIPDGKEKVKLGNNLSYKIFDLPVLSAQTTVQKQVDAVVHGMQDVYNKTDIMQHPWFFI